MFANVVIRTSLPVWPNSTGLLSLGNVKAHICENKPRTVEKINNEICRVINELDENILCQQVKDSFVVRTELFSDGEVIICQISYSMYKFEFIYYTLIYFYVFNKIITKLNLAFSMKLSMYYIILFQMHCYNYSVCVEFEEVNKKEDYQKLKKIKNSMWKLQTVSKKPRKTGKSSLPTISQKKIYTQKKIFEV